MYVGVYMKLSDYVNSVGFGYNLSSKEVNDKCFKNYEYKMLTITSINSGFIYSNELKDYISDMVINEKFLTKVGDIVVCCKQPYNMVLIKTEKDENILVNSNFIILRDIKIDRNYLYNYLLLNRGNIIEKKRKQQEKVSKVNENLSKPDIEDLEIVIPKKQNMNKLARILREINERQSLYDSLINNDKELIKTFLEKEGVINND